MFIEEPKENYGTGWIKIYRSIHRHWLWSKPLSKMEAWIDILLEANHTQEKVNLGNELFTCDRGEKMYSLDTWGERWGWHKSKVRRFIKLLENDSMIELKSNRYTTHLKVSNYNTYQDMRNSSESKSTPILCDFTKNDLNIDTPNLFENKEVIEYPETEVKRKRNGSETQTTPIKELNNDKVIKEEKKKENIFIMVNERKIITKEYFIDLIPVNSEQKFIESWVEWVDYRKEIKKKITPSSAKKQIDFLLGQLNPIEIINTSIKNQWQGLFPNNGISERHPKELDFT